MKVLILTPDLREVGGISAYVRDFIAALESFGVAVKVVERRRGRARKLSFILKALLRLFFFRSHVVVCAHANFSVLCALSRALVGKKYLVLSHGKEVFNLNSSQRRAFKDAEKIISVSRFTAQRIAIQVPAVRENMVIIPPAVDGDTFYPKEKPDYLVRRHNVSGKQVIFTLARIERDERYKGYDKVIAALPLVLQEMPTAVYILGGGGNDLEAIRQMVRAAGLTEVVSVIGPIPAGELVDYYNLCDVFIMPSKSEGFGIVFAEALACGKPVIAGNSDGSREALLHGEVGMLVDPNDIREIAAGIISLLKREGAGSALTDVQLREKILEHYGFDRFRGRVGILISKLL